MNAACLAVVMLASVAPTRGAVTLFQAETFDTDGGWTSGSPNPNPPVVFPDSGPLGAGDASWRLTASGGNGPGGKLVTYNRTTWSGDYSGEGITALALDLRNLGANPLFIRLAFNGPGGWFVTPAQSVAPFTGWEDHLFDLRPTFLQAVSGGTSAAETMAGVTELRILHSAPADHQGAIVSASLLVDNVMAVPEPSSAVLVLLAPPVVLRRKRRFAKIPIL